MPVGGWLDSAASSVLPPAHERPYPAPDSEEGSAPLGSPPVVAVPNSSHSFIAIQPGVVGQPRPVAWSPCRPIHYVIDPTTAPPGFAEQVHAAVADLSAQTGLAFADDGLTTEAADADRPAFQPERYADRWAPVLIRFTDATQVPLLSGDVAGVASPVRAHNSATGVEHFVTGAVYLDVDILDQESPDGSPTYLTVLRHELGHLVGLDHVQDPTQLMNPTTSEVTTFQNGDLTGLAALGAGPCAPEL